MLDFFLDFEGILEGARNRKCENVDLLIERAPVCKSIFVRGIPEDTPQEMIEEYFDQFGVVERIVSNIGKVEESKVKDHRAILYFKSERSKSAKNLSFVFFPLTPIHNILCVREK